MPLQPETNSKSSESPGSKFTMEQPYLPLPVPGIPSPKNRRAMDWGRNGLLAVGNGTEIIIVDPGSLKPIAFLSYGHKSSVDRVLWNPHARPIYAEKHEKQSRDLVSTDSSNCLIIWDTEKCQALSHFTHSSSRKIESVKFSQGCDVWQKTKLFLLYSEALFVVLDIVTLTYQNIQVVDTGSPGGGELSLLDFDTDPFYSNYSSGLAFVNENYVYFLNNWDPLKMKQEKMVITQKMFYNKGKANSPGPSQNSLEVQPSMKRSSSSGIRKLMSDIIVGPDYPSSSNSNTSPAEEVFVAYHRNLNYHLLVCTKREIYLINTQFYVTLNTFRLERNISSFVQTILPVSRPAVITLQENGMITLKKYLISGNHTKIVSLETVTTSDAPRLTARKSVIGMSFDKNNENKIILLVSDGRLIRYDINCTSKEESQVDKKPKHLLTPMTPYVGIGTETLDIKDEHDIETPKVQTVQPSLGNMLQSIVEPDIGNIKIKLKRITNPIGSITIIKSLPTSKNLLVAGTVTGDILIFNLVSSGADSFCELSRKFTIHSNSPVSGIEFASENEILTFSNMSLSVNPKCELILVEINTGSMKALKQDDSHHISFIKVSPLHQYVLLVYKNGIAPCELWDLPRRQHIKTLPAKLPPISCATWKEENVEGVREETFYMTDLGTFLFTFRVDGNRFLNATCVKLDTAGTSSLPVSLVANGKLLFRADNNGMLVIYDTEKKTASPGISLGLRPLLKIEKGFGEYESHIFAQFSDTIELWHLTEVRKIKILHTGKLYRISDVCWNDGFLTAVTRATSGLKFIPVSSNLKPSVSVQNLTKYPYYLTKREKCMEVLSLFENEYTGREFISVFDRLCLSEESTFWTIAMSSLLRSNQNEVIEATPGINIYSGNVFYKNIMVKLAQCVWFSDVNKREDVAKFLHSAGESEKAAEILLDTEPSVPIKYISNGMKAALSVGSGSLPESTKAVLKIVATNLIASNEMDDGLEMLCILNKHSDAVKYIESANQWDKAILMCKTSLAQTQAEETLNKYAHFLNGQRQALKSASIYAYIGNFGRAIEVLFGARKRYLCYILLQCCEKQKIDLTSLSDHVKLAIKLDFVRFIFDCGLVKEAIEYCDTIGEPAKDLKSELEILTN